LSGVFDVVVAGLHLRYDGVRQRPQHVLSRLSRRVPVIVLEEPLRAEEDRDEVRELDGLTVVRPLRRAWARDADAQALAAVRALCAGRTPLVWLYTPLMLPLADAFPGAPLAYDCMDDLAAFAFASPELRAYEAALLRRAGVVFAGGRTLYERRKAENPNVRLYPSGVDVAHFACAADLAPHLLLRDLDRPIYGYTGVLDERIDYTIVRALAAADANTVFVGPVAKIDPAILPRSARVHFTGAMPYDTLPSLLAGFDVAIMPFALNEATRSISPTKTPEYLAAGKPVVSTRVPDVVADYADIVTFAAGADAFVEACARVADEPDARRVTRGRERVRGMGWDETVARMWRDALALG
jgi:UDP-galactopyranose mutase